MLGINRPPDALDRPFRAVNVPPISRHLENPERRLLGLGQHRKLQADAPVRRELVHQLVVQQELTGRFLHLIRRPARATRLEVGDDQFVAVFDNQV